MRDGRARRYRRNRRAELDGAYLYRLLAELEQDPTLSAVYGRLADTEQRHADFWAEQLTRLGTQRIPQRVSRRARLLGWLARRWGPEVLLPILAAGEAAGRRMYDQQPEASEIGMPADERSHARVLALLERHTGGGVAGRVIARAEGRHPPVSGNALRAAVLGANDGLVSNLALIMGVAGASIGDQPVVIAGLAGLLAGAASMALGEWLSVQSAREMYERQIEVEREEIAAFPEEEAEELALILQARGVDPDTARRLAGATVADPERALAVQVREELGVDPEQLGGSPWEAAGTSFLLFSLGAAVPLVPFLVTGGLTALLASIGLSALALFGFGAGITLFTGRSALWSGARQLLLGGLAAAVTYGTGYLLGVTVA